MKKILEEIARQLRSTLPFAIVDNGTWADGSHRGKSWFSKILCYDNIQAAIDDEHSVIKIKSGLYEPFIIRESSNYGRGVFNIEGAGSYASGDNPSVPDKKGTLIDGGTKSPAILADAGGGASYTETICNLQISHLMVRTTAGGGQTNSAIDLKKLRRGVFISHVHVIGSDDNGMTFSSCNDLRVEDCEIRNADNFGIYIDHPQWALSSSVGGFSNKILRCTIQNCASHAIMVDGASNTAPNGIASLFRNNYITSIGSTAIYIASCQGVQVVSNFISSCAGWGIHLTSASQYSIAAGNVFYNNTSGTITNTGTGNVIADNIGA